MQELTYREQDFFNLLFDGKTIREISHSLNISYNTAKFHQRNIYQKLGVHNINELYKKYQHSEPAKEIETVFDFWFALGDNTSETFVTRKKEEINGKIISAVTISGTLDSKNAPASGVYGRPNTETHEALKTAAAITFTVLGDGNSYKFCFPTQETTIYTHIDIRNVARDEVFGDHYMMIVPTVNGEISNITINIPKDLIRVTERSKAEFVQKNILYLQIQPINPGDYRLKFWDIRLLR